MKKIFDKKYILGIITGMLLIGGIGVVLAVAIASSEVTYSTAKNANVETVEDALNDLYEKASTVPNTLVNAVITQNKIEKSRTDFSTIYNANTTGKIFRTDRTDDDSEIYYYAGNTTHNWVIFGNNGNGTYYYWRIIRTNSDQEGGGVRLLYSGSGNSATSIPSNLTNAIATTSVFNSNYAGAEYAGYMYTAGSQHGHANSSNIKTALENWYTTSKLNTFEEFINQDAVYCNDRSVNTAAYTWASAPSSTFYYAGLTRLSTNKYPTHKCGGDISGGYYESAENRLEDRFSKTTNGGGNGYLSKPIGLMTADEISFAGGLYGTNSPQAWYYLNGNGASITGSTWWWLASSNGWDATYGHARAFVVRGSSLPGDLYNASVRDTSGSVVRPVISLKSNVVASGLGTISNPYIVEGLL